MKIRVAILGPTGYTGLWLIQLLLRHPQAVITYLASHREEQPDIGKVFPALLNRLPPNVAQCRPIDAEAIAREADVVFLGLPHSAAMAYVPALLDAGLRVIDLSADYRTPDAETYEKIYKTKHTDIDNLKDAVYGLPELFGENIPGAILIANPGCYPTTATLAIWPLLQRGLVSPDAIVINATSGVTGAGKKPTEALHFPEQNEAFGPYGTIGGHRHQAEINQNLSRLINKDPSVLFVPHLLPVDRGILETIYLDPTDDEVTQADLYEALKEAYDDQPFVRVREDLPNIKYVRDTNFCDLSARLVEGPTRKVILFGALDNMIKGASGQAIQNMNIVFEQPQTLGLL